MEESHFAVQMDGQEPMRRPKGHFFVCYGRRYGVRCSLMEWHLAIPALHILSCRNAIWVNGRPSACCQCFSAAV